MRFVDKCSRISRDRCIGICSEVLCLWFSNRVQCPNPPAVWEPACPWPLSAQPLPRVLSVLPGVQRVHGSGAVCTHGEGRLGRGGGDQSAVGVQLRSAQDGVGFHAGQRNWIQASGFHARPRHQHHLHDRRGAGAL